MAITFTPEVSAAHGKPIHAGGDFYVLLGSIAFSGNYVTGGEAPSVIGGTPYATLRDLLKSVGSGSSVSAFRIIIPPNLGYTFTWNNLTEKILVFQGDNTNAAAAPSIEIPAAAYPGALSNPITGGAGLIGFGF